METSLKKTISAIVSQASDFFEVSVEIRLFGVRVFSFTWPPKEEKPKNL